jgi:hypothetical protein
MLTELPQNDPRWENNTPGFNSSITIHQCGCQLTSAAMILHDYGGNEDPAKQDNENNTLLKRYGKTGTLEDIIQEVVWIGMASDPPPDELITPQKTTTQSDTQKTAPAPNTASTAAPTSATGGAAQAAQRVTEIYVQPIVESLSFRSEPITSPDTLIKLLPFRSKLKDTDSQALSKVGRQNQWLKVQDSDGTNGYVAGWLVTSTEAPALGVRLLAETEEKPAPPTPPPADIKVRTNIESLSLRKEPRVADDTLIKYLPFGTELTLMDNGQSGRIGQQNQWLHVRAKEGDEGYVAAWYVIKI